MSSAAPMFASEATAARLLDLSPAELRALVEAGHLPRPCRIGGAERYDMTELRRAIRGEPVEPGGMQWAT